MWPVRPMPYPGESLSSWLTRLAHANGVETAELCRLLWGSRFWQARRDLDRMSLRQLQPLSTATGLPLERIHALTINALEERLGRTGRPWLLAQGDPQDRRPRYDRQACVLCLKTSPYHRLAWRLAFVTVCTRHKTLLIDRCAACSSRLAPPLVPMGRSPFGRCFKCGYTLRQIGHVTRNARASSLQHLALAVLEQGTLSIPSGARVPATAFFEALHATMRQAATATGRQDPALDQHGKHVRVRFAGRWTPLSHIAPAGRYRLLRLTAEILEPTTLSRTTPHPKSGTRLPTSDYDGPDG